MKYLKLTNDWVRGFTDGEGCFHTSIVKVEDMRLKKRPIPEFVVTQHQRSMHVLEGLQSFFQCGLIKRNHGDRFCFCVRSIEHLDNIILPFFAKHPLLTKNEEVKVFQKIVRLMRKKEHLTIEGLEKIEKLSQILKDLKRIA